MDSGKTSLGQRLVKEKGQVTLGSKAAIPGEGGADPGVAGWSKQGPG